MSPGRFPELDALFGRLASAIASHAVWVALAAVAIAAACAVHAARELEVQVDTVAMFRTDLPHLQRWYEFEERYPLLAEPLVVVVDEPQGNASDAAARLAEAMEGEPDLFAQVYAPGSDPFFRRHGLLYRSADEIADLGDRLAQAQPFLAALDREPTLEGLFELLEEAVDWAEDEPEGRGLETLLTAVETEVSAASDPRRAESSLLAALFDETAGADEPTGSTRALVLALPRAGRAGINPALPAIERIRIIADELGISDAPGARVRVTGDLALSADELDLLNENAVVTAAVSFVLVTGILMVGLRSARLVLALCLTLAIGLMWTAGFAALAIGRLNMISVAFAVVSIGLGIDFGIHLGMRYRELAQRGTPTRTAVSGAMRETGSALLWCALTTAIGFYAFLPTDFRGLAEFGLISGTGILLSLVATLIALPALLVASKPRIRLRRPGRRLETLLAWPLRHSRAVLGVTLAVTVLAAGALPALRFSGNPLDLRVPDSDSASAFRDLLASDGDTTWNLYATRRTPEEARRLADELEELEVVDRATTLDDLIPADQEQKLSLLEDIALLLGPIALDREAGGSTHEEREESLAEFGEDLDCDEVSAEASGIAAACSLRAAIGALLRSLDAAEREPVLARLEARLIDPLQNRLDDLQRALEAEQVTYASLPAAVKDLWRSADGMWRVEVSPAGSLDTDEELASFVAEVRTRAPDVTGMAVNVAEANRMVVESLRLAFALAAMAIALLLAVIWRSTDVLRTLVPIAMASLWILGGTVFLGMSLNFANIIVLPLILGIGIDSGVHLVALHRRSGGKVDLLSSSTTRAILLSSLTTVASFGSLSFSPHPGMASMGRLLVVGVVCTLIANLFVLPALLVRWERREVRRATAAAPAEVPLSSSQQ